MTNILHIYTRVSSKIQQEEGTSLEIQKQLGIKKSEELGFDFRLWNEGGQSSFHDDLNNRPVLVGLLTLIESGSVKHLYVYNTDRLSRNQQTWAVIRYKLLAHGVTLHTSSGQMELKNPVDDLMLGILSEISQYDNRIRSERSRMGRFQKVQQGGWKGGPPPFGYRLINRRLEIDPFESDWVQKMYDWYCHGITVKQIQSRLSRHGVMTRRGNEQWSTGSIQLILRNPVYVGYYDYTDKMVGETVRIPTPPIINAHLFQITQDKRKRTLECKHQVNPSKHFYLLRGLLICGHCGFTMGGRTHKAGHQHLYYCVKKERTWKTRDHEQADRKRGTECSMVRSINIAKTDQLVWGMIKSVIQQIRELSPNQSDLAGQEKHVHCDGDDFLSDGITWISPEQIDLLSDADRKKVVTTYIRTIKVFFDGITKQHRLDIEFSEVIARLLASASAPQRASVDCREHAGDTCASLCEGDRVHLGGDAGKKQGGSGVNSAAEQDYSVTVE